MKYSHIFIFTLLLVSTGFAFSQPLWLPTGGPEGGDVSCFATARNGTLYCGTWQGGVYRSNDSGRIWIPYGSVGLGESVLSIAVDTGGTRVYAGTWSQKIFRNTSGSGWVHADSGINLTTVRQLAVNSNDVLFAKADQNHSNFNYYRSINHGDSWSAINAGLPTNRIFDVDGIGIAPNNDLYAGGYYGIYRSTNNGDSWSITGSTGIYTFDCFAFDYTAWNDSLVYAGGDQIFKSTNSGQSWTQLGTNTAYCYGLDFVTPYIYAATSQGILRNNSISTTWTNVGLSNFHLLAITHGGNNILTGTLSDGVYNSLNGTTWTQSHGIWSVFPFDILMPDTNIYIGTSSGIFHASQNDSVWHRISPPSTDIFSVSVDQSGAIYSGQSNGIFRSTNNGGTWTSIGLSGNSIYWIVPAPMGNLYVATGNGIVSRTTNTGTTWTTIHQVQADINTLFIYPTLIPESWQVYVATDSGLYRCLEDGRNWSLVGMAGTRVYNVHLRPDNTFAAASNSGIYISSNGGDTWTRSGWTMPVYDINWTVEGFAFFISDSGVCMTSGQSGWVRYNSGLPPTRATCLNIPFVGMAGAGVFRLRDILIGVNEPKLTAPLPQRVQLLPNYPNPFNSVTTISFSLPRASDTKVEIFNSIGELVEIVASARMATGQHHLSWNATGIPSGLYWCRLTAGSESQTRKMLYLK